MYTQVIQHSNSNQGLKQPTALYDLFMFELWERFSYYGMQILLVFFIGEYIGLTRTQAIELNGAFLALVYASPTFGGYIADRWFGIKRTLMLGAILLCAGYTGLGFLSTATAKTIITDQNVFLAAVFWSMGIIAVANGCFKPNPTSLLAKVYKENDPRIDAGYTMFYMSINIGSGISLLLTPIIEAQFGYSQAFFCCSIGLLLGIVRFATRLYTFKGKGGTVDFEKLSTLRYASVLLAVLALTIFAAYLLANLFYARLVIMATVIGVMLMFSYLSVTLPKVEGNKVQAIMILLVLSAIFFSLQLQMFGVINVFIKNHVVREFWGFNIPAGNFAALNPLWIIIFSPILAKSYLYLEKHKIPLSIPSRFSAGLLLTALGFLLLGVAVPLDSNPGMISATWIIVVYFLISLGEMLVSALGLALICKLAPPKMISMFMGAFLLSVAIGGWISGMVGYWIEVPQNSTDHLALFRSYTTVFFNLGLLTTCSAILATLLVPKLKSLIGTA